MREIVVDVEIIVVEGAVLLRIQHFEKRGRRVSLEIAAELVDLIEHHYRVGCAGPCDAVDDPARKGSHVGFPMTPDLGFVVHSAEGNPDVFPAECPCNGLSEAGLAHARRPVEAENRGFHVSPELEHGEIFDDPFLHLLQPEMVGVQDLGGMPEVEIVLGNMIPGEFEHELYIIVLYAVVG